MCDCPGLLPWIGLSGGADTVERRGCVQGPLEFVDAPVNGQILREPGVSEGT
jgi:hypothetical protein